MTDRKDSDDPGHPDYYTRGLDEGHMPFEPALPEPVATETLRQLYTAVLRLFDFTCAMTGHVYKVPSDFLHDDLEIVPIRPLTMGGALHVTNFLCLETNAATAFRAGHVTVGPDFELVADLSRIDPELLEALHPLGRLLRPDPKLSQPDQRALAFHREQVFLH